MNFNRFCTINVSSFERRCSFARGERVDTADTRQFFSCPSTNKDCRLSWIENKLSSLMSYIHFLRKKILKDLCSSTDPKYQYLHIQSIRCTSRVAQGSTLSSKLDKTRTIWKYKSQQTGPILYPKQTVNLPRYKLPPSASTQKSHCRRWWDSKLVRNPTTATVHTAAVYFWLCLALKRLQCN